MTGSIGGGMETVKVDLMASWIGMKQSGEYKVIAGSFLVGVCCMPLVGMGNVLT